MYLVRLMDELGECYFVKDWKVFCFLDGVGKFTTLIRDYEGF